ncbi:amino acid adenylation domain-containing protein [Reyranella sp.]|uniref:amino acid adenylation domain-containing protein n=1 Tax=Reyranella sp. TaxID=1929291 RepID=UPI003BAC1D61
MRDDGAEQVPHERSLVESGNVASRFVAAARAAGTAIALVEGSRSITYDALDRRTNRLARWLKRRGAGPQGLVALQAGRSLESTIAIVATLKAGAGYVALDPSAPAAYRDWIVEDSRPVLILCAQAESVKASTPSVGLEEALVQAEAESDDPIENEADGDGIACVMYTSGSTGRPKGVRIPHRAIVRLVSGQTYIHFGADEVVLHNAPLFFDASLLEIWGTLLHGACGVLVSEDRPSLKSLSDTISRHGVTTAWFTAGLFHALVDHELDGLLGLRQLLAGGDILSPAHVSRALAALPHCQLVNGYGPTENTTFTCCYRIPRDGWGGGPVPIGEPIAGTYVRVLDDEMRPVPDGEVGMLHAGGLGLALDYLGDPRRTAEQFVADPQRPGATLYRTGDLVRRRADGMLDFLGRRDGQVKIDGKRVEVGEIEEALRRCPEIGDAVVLATKGDGGLVTLTAYVKPALPGREVEAASAAQTQAIEVLPAHMRPSRAIGVETFPLTVNGKIDRQRLAARARIEPLTPVTASSATEHTLGEIFARVLGLPRVDVGINFFELGATSLKLLEAHAEITRLWPGVEVLSLFRHATIRDLARALDSGPEAAATRARRRADKQAAMLRIRTAGLGR